MKTNPLGDIRAEHDHIMLDQAFYETPEYRSLIEEHTRRVVVGRRGTGKSALFYQLQKHWNATPKTLVVELSPSETDVIGLRPFVRLSATNPHTSELRVLLHGNTLCYAKSFPKLLETTKFVQKKISRIWRFFLERG